MPSPFGQRSQSQCSIEEMGRPDNLINNTSHLQESPGYSGSDAEVLSVSLDRPPLLYETEWTVEKNTLPKSNLLLQLF
ncbi:unnamed protein product [Protopolystoma xenopodis]|uniref:Uncharacterized protein n=1 Tax=Protopolystoma xenopodis TaxID=117903 RepID=A0A3S5CGD9_9PLAT|nr:unnamed protein product [Protopolystoma xenopodis]